MKFGVQARVRPPFLCCNYRVLCFIAHSLCCIAFSLYLCAHTSFVLMYILFLISDGSYAKEGREGHDSEERTARNVYVI